jgi:hypothetical protein
MRYLKIAVLLGVTAGVTACGDDDDDTAAACDAFVAVDEELSINEDLEAGIAAVEAFVASAPDDVADAAEPFLVLLRDDPEAAFESEELAAAETATDDWARDNCADTRVDIEAVNFAFVGVPREVKAGRVAFTLTNHTQTDEVHEALLLRKNDDVTGSADEILSAALEGHTLSVETTLGAFEQFTFVGAGLVEPPGGDGYDVFVVDLEPGEYLLACLLPVDSPEHLDRYFAGEEVDSTYHFHSGMFAELTVS